MPSLFHKSADGTTYSFNSQTGHWGAEKEGKKKIAYKSADMLKRRLRGWSAEEKHNKAVEAKATSSIPLAIVTVENAFARLGVSPYGLSVKGNTETVQKTDRRIERVRAWTGNEDFPISGPTKAGAVDPRTFDEGDQAFWKDTILHDLGAEHLSAAEETLRGAWKKLLAAEPVSCTITDVQLKGSDKSKEGTWDIYGADQRGVSQGIPEVVRSTWNVLDQSGDVRALDAKLAGDWKQNDEGALVHPSGVRLELYGEPLEGHPDRFDVCFLVTMPGTNKGAGAVFRSTDIKLASRVAELTAKVVERQAAPVTQWRAPQAAYNAKYAYEIPISGSFEKVKTQAVGFILDPSIAKGPQTMALVLQKPRKVVADGELRDAEEDSLAWIPLWQARGTYLERDPLWAKDLMAINVEIKIAARNFSTMHQVDLEEALAKMDQAAVAMAYEEALIGQATDEATAVRRVSDYLEKVKAEVAQDPTLVALEKIEAKAKQLAAGLLAEHKITGTTPAEEGIPSTKAIKRRKR